MALTCWPDNQDWPPCGICGQRHRKQRAARRCWEKALDKLYHLTRYPVRAYFPTITAWPAAPTPIKARLSVLRRQRWELQQRRPKAVTLTTFPGFPEWVAAGLPGLDALRAAIERQIRENEPQTAPLVAAVEAYVAEVVAFQRAADQEITALRKEMGWPTWARL